MKVKDLLERRIKLRTKIVDLGKELAELGEQMQEKDLSVFIQNGILPSPDGHRIQKLRNQHKYLLKLGISLDQEIAKSNEGEKQKGISKLVRGADQFKVIRLKLSSRIEHYQAKITQLRADQKILRTKEDELRREAHLMSRPTKEVSLRLNKMESFMKENMLSDLEFETEVLAKRKHLG